MLVTSDNKMEDSSANPGKKVPESTNNNGDVKNVEKSDDMNNIPPSSNNLVDNTSKKVIVYNIAKFTKEYEIKKLVKQWLEGTDIECVKTKKPPRQNWLVLTLSKEEMVDQLINILNDGRHMNKKGGLLRAQRASDRAEKRGRDDGDGNGARKRMKRDDYVKTADEVRDAVTPLWRSTYEEQLKLKTRNMIFKSLSKITKEINGKVRMLKKDKSRQQCKRANDDSSFDWLKGKNPIRLDPISKAPKLFEYRNKSELTFGYRHSYVDEQCEETKPTSENSNDNTVETEQKTSEIEEGGDDAEETEKKRKIIKTPVVGFMAGGWAGGASSPHVASNIPDIVCGIADIVNEFLRDSPIPPYTSSDHQGIWRFITIRSSDRTKQCMIVICHAPATGGAGARSDGSDDYSAVFESEKQRLIKMLTEKIPMPKRELAGPGTESKDETKEKKEEYCDYKVTSLFFQEFDGLSNPKPEHPVQHAYGKTFLEERLLQCTFQISPGAFFQVTTEGAENLYQIVVDKLKEVTKNPKDTLLFDVCCGTGTIGLTCMKEGAVGKVVGIDISEPAIKDAIINAEKNGYTGTDGCAKFVASRAEKAMYGEIKRAGYSTPMVAVVDPAREGLHRDVLKALRDEKRINRIIYVSCNPTGSLVKDAGSLCSPETKKFSGKPFKITSAQPVDMFPLTDHCEMVMVFDRISEEELNGDKSKVKEEGGAVNTTTETKVKEEEKPEKSSSENVDEIKVDDTKVGVDVTDTKMEEITEKESESKNE
jgi:tRNA (uracil-5-)-methyltransferase